jgi:hypothetical protein
MSVIIELFSTYMEPLSRRVANDLERFKEFIEARGQETGKQ